MVHEGFKLPSQKGAVANVICGTCGKFFSSKKSLKVCLISFYVEWLLWGPENWPDQKGDEEYYLS